MKLAFTGTIVACETRFTSPVKRAFVVGDIDARWILTVDIEAADPEAPAPAGDRTSFLIHSPTHTLRGDAEGAPGRRFRFTIEREDIEDRIRWSSLEGRALE